MIWIPLLDLEIVHSPFDVVVHELQHAGDMVLVDV
jgi:hypothetical protein